MRTFFVLLFISTFVGSWRADFLDDTPVFHQGQLVKTVLGGYEGQIVAVYCGRPCEYWVRFARPVVVTDTKLIAPDGPFKTKLFTTQSFKDFELIPEK